MSLAVNPYSKLTRRIVDYSSDEDESDDEVKDIQKQLEAAEEENNDGKDSTPSNKKRQTAEEIRKSLALEEKKKTRPPRPKLTIEHLTGTQGLLRVQTDFRTLHQKHKITSKTDTKGAAAFGRALQQHYETFCEDLFPSAAFEDVLLKIEQLGSKREIKNYLEHLRQSVRREHLEKIYGVEKAEEMMSEYEMGLRQQQEQDAEFLATTTTALDPKDDPRDDEEAPKMTSAPFLEAEKPAATEDSPPKSVSPTAPTLSGIRPIALADSDDELEFTTTSEPPSKRKRVIEDDDEEEMVFGE